MRKSPEPKIYSLAVVGGGAAGVMAALRGVLNNDKTLFFPGTFKERRRSRAFWVSKIENMPGYFQYTKAITEPHKETLEWITKSPFAEKFHWLKSRGATGLAKTPQGHFQLTDDKGEKYCAKYVILATGMMDVQPHIGGEIAPILPFANIQLADYCLRCDGHHVLHKRLGVIGHGSGAAWVAIMLHERYNPPSAKIFTNGESPRFDEETSHLLAAYKIGVETEEITAVEGDLKEKRLDGLRLAGGALASVDICFVSLGARVYNHLAKTAGAKVDGRGFVLTDGKGQSSVEGLFVAGDLRAGIKKQVYTAWDSAVDSADQINALLRQERRPKMH